jgi:glycosyl transferase family 90
LALCDNRPDRFLVPDTVFVPTKGYRAARAAYQASDVPWDERQPVVFWRGTTTGVPRAPGDWRSLERIRLCELVQNDAHQGLFDAGISDIVQFDDPTVVREIRESGLFRGFVPWQQWNRYKYHIDIDGNANAWSAFFYRLLTGSPVLKVESSRGMMQWFYDRLKPWMNYVPIAPDISDLVDKARWLARNPATAQKIGQRGREFAEAMTYERELERAAPVISTAFRYFAGQTDGIGPYGRG